MQKKTNVKRPRRSPTQRQLTSECLGVETGVRFSISMTVEGVLLPGVVGARSSALPDPLGAEDVSLDSLGEYFCTILETSMLLVLLAAGMFNHSSLSVSKHNLR